MTELHLKVQPKPSSVLKQLILRKLDFSKIVLLLICTLCPHSKHRLLLAATSVSALHKVNSPPLCILTSLWDLLSAGVGHGFASSLICEKYRNIFELLFTSLSNMAKFNF